MLLGLGDNSVAFCVILRCGGSNTDIVPLGLARIFVACDKMALSASVSSRHRYEFGDRTAILPCLMIVLYDCGGSASLESDPSSLESDPLPASVSSPYRCGYRDRIATLPCLMIVLYDCGGSASLESDPSLLGSDPLRSKYDSSSEEFATQRVEVTIERRLGFGTVGSWTVGCSLRSWTAGWFLRSACFLATLSRGVATGLSIWVRGSWNGHCGLQARWLVPVCLLT